MIYLTLRFFTSSNLPNQKRLGFRILRLYALDLENILITVDEVHNFLGKKTDPVLVWWLTYHGHLHQDLFFITQDLSLIAAEYKKNAEYFYKAIPPSARLSTKKFRYTQYRNSRMAMNGIIKDFTLPALPEIFNMYVSGAENKSKSVVQKYLYISFFFIFVLFIAILLFIASFDDDVPIDNNSTNSTVITNTQNSNVSSSNNKVIKLDNEDKQLFDINCFNNICTYKKIDFPKLLLTKIINDNSDSFAYKIENPSFTKYFVLVHKDTFNFLQIGGNEDEKNSKNTKKGSKSTFSLL